ncbi:unnamed protein product [Echinostoma caproni]|uniref:Protein-serine/threonine phosphatase n=1 Tax=Echinostoma caproni TaxID=27848 RepID=A0A183B9M7_9TREM|nr:unnamed protein product [Echinostoma caproni]
MDGTDASNSLPLRGTGHSASDLGIKSTGKLRSDGQPMTDICPGVDASWTLDEAEIQFELHLAERDMESRFNCVFVVDDSHSLLPRFRSNNSGPPLCSQIE